MRIPSAVYTKYAEAMTMFSSTDNFGVQCSLVYQKIETLSSSPSEIRQRLTMSPQVGQAGMIRGSEATKLVETTQSIVLRVYSDKKSFERIGGFEFAPGSCLTIGTLSQMEDLKRATALIINHGLDGESRLERSGEVLIWGLNSDYCVAHWRK